MNKFSNRLTDCRSRLLDAEANLNFMRNRENLQTLLSHDSPDVVVGAMIDHAWNLVAAASGDCEAMTEAEDEDLKAELRESVRGITQQAIKPLAESANASLDNPVDDLCLIHSQTQALLLMLMVYLEQAKDGGEELSEIALENYVGQLVTNMEQAEKATQALIDTQKQGAGHE
ncbi:hypothetical protein [Marinobacter salarius]|uniref:hypothetical protein n=1 Tax=Marinobacter salarius TaxID=1420917 RepID=UPI003BAAB0DE